MQSQVKIREKYFQHKNIRMKTLTLAGNKRFSFHFLPHTTRIFHLSTENGRTEFVGNGQQNASSRADVFFKSTIISLTGKYGHLSSWSISV